MSVTLYTNAIGATDVMVSGDDLATLYKKVPTFKEFAATFHTRNGHPVTEVRVSRKMWADIGWCEPQGRDYQTKIPDGEPMVGRVWGQSKAPEKAITVDGADGSQWEITAGPVPAEDGNPSETGL
jgi:hypothetical protein